MLEQAQSDIFKGFWESFATAFGIITLVMIISLRSVSVSLLAMIPNLTPICIVFGILGWMGTSVDIGMMMTASIALGIAVDGTFHFFESLIKKQPWLPELLPIGPHGLPCYTQAPQLPKLQ